MGRPVCGRVSRWEGGSVCRCVGGWVGRWVVQALGRGQYWPLFRHLENLAVSCVFLKKHYTVIYYPILMLFTKQAVE